MRIRQTEQATGERGMYKGLSATGAKMTRQEKEGGEVYEEKDKNSWTVPDDRSCWFLRYQALVRFRHPDRMMNSTDGGDIEDEIKKEEELDALANQTLEISKSGEYTVSFRNAELKGREGSLAIVNKTGKPMRLEITETLARTSVSSPDNKLTDLQWNHNQGNKTLSGGGYLNPLASTRLDLKFRSDYQGGTYFVVNASISEVKDLGGKSFRSGTAHREYRKVHRKPVKQYFHQSGCQKIFPLPCREKAFCEHTAFQRRRLLCM